MSGIKWKPNLTAVLLLICVHHSFTLDEYADAFGDVIFANVLFRHGDRTPINPYPTDPYNNLSYWPEGYGQLTNRGKERHYEHGKWLRARYSNLLGAYNKKLIYVQSTDVDRTLMSAECNLAALFPPEGSQDWRPDMPWQPVPVHTIPEHMDKVLAGKADCPRYTMEKAKVLESKEIKDLNKKYKDVFDYVSLHSGSDIHDITNIEYLYDILFIEQDNNLTLPMWTKSVFPEPLREIAKISFILPTWNKEMGRLKVGLLIGEMVHHLKEKYNKVMNPDRNLWYYSAHDSTVANLLNTLGVFDLQTPPYTATVLMELRIKNSQPFVTLLYRNTTKEPYLLTIPGCTSSCPLNQFIELTKAVVPQNWELECHAHYLFDFTSDLPYNNIAIFAMVTSALLIFLLVASMSFYWQKKKPKHWYRKLKTDTI